MNQIGSIQISRGIIPLHPQTGRGLAGNGVPHSPNAVKAPAPQRAARGGPVQRGLGNTRASGVQTAATNLG